MKDWVLNPIKQKLKGEAEKHQSYWLFRQKNIRLLSTNFRSLPNFLIIGTMKGGTSSLYSFLSEHPCILPATKKEIHFFDSKKYKAGKYWYTTNFPKLETIRNLKKTKPNVITGEATPGYMYHPLAVRRIKDVVPNAKLIVILRNPVDRAYSHYNYNVKRNLELLSFEEALDLEEKRLEREIEKILKNELYELTNFLNYSYLYRGHYFDQLEKILKIFKKTQIQVVSSEELLKDPKKILNRIYEFLEVPSYQNRNILNKNVGKYLKMNDTTRKFLVEYFKPHNEKLYNLLNTKFDWDK